MNSRDMATPERAERGLMMAAAAQNEIVTSEKQILSAKRKRAVGVKIAMTNGRSLRAIAQAIGVSHGTIQNILKAERSRSSD